MYKTSSRVCPSAAGIAICLLILPVVLSGCIPYKELKEESIVEGMGIDYASGGYSLTFQIYNPQSGGGGGGGVTQKSSASNTVKVLESTGASIFDAVRGATLQNGRKLYFSNTRAYVVGEEVCKDEFSRILDFMERNQEIRPRGHIYVAKGKAADILTFEKDGETVPVQNLELISEGNIQTSKIENITLFDVFRNVENGITDPKITAVSIKKSGNGEDIIQMDGTAVFKNNRLAGYLDKTQTRGCMWITGKAKGGVLTLSLPDGGIASMEVIGSSCNVSLSGDDKNPVINVKISTSTNLTELQSKSEYTINDDFISKLKKLQDKTVTAEAQDAVNQALKTYGSDIFGFGLKIYEDKPELWHKIGESWGSDAQNLKVEITVDSQIMHTGLTTQTAFTSKSDK